MRKWTYIFILVILLFGCLNNIKENSLIGKYHFNTYKQDVIDVYKNHTYSHRHINSEGKVFEVHGKWTYNGKQIAFYNFNFFNDLGTTGGDGIWVSEVVKDSDKIKFIYSDDDDTCFEKE